jgi:hypothetical protein
MSAPLLTDPGILRGAAMVLAQMCRRGKVHVARLIAADLSLVYEVFVWADVDEADLEELRVLFEVPPADNVLSFRAKRSVANRSSRSAVSPLRS